MIKNQLIKISTIILLTLGVSTSALAGLCDKNQGFRAGGGFICKIWFMGAIAQKICKGHKDFKGSQCDNNATDALAKRSAAKVKAVANSVPANVTSIKDVIAYLPASPKIDGLLPKNLIGTRLPEAQKAANVVAANVEALEKDVKAASANISAPEQAKTNTFLEMLNKAKGNLKSTTTVQSYDKVAEEQKIIQQALDGIPALKRMNIKFEVYEKIDPNDPDWN